MKNNLRVLSTGGLAAVLFCGSQSVIAECTGDAINGFDCDTDGPGGVAVGAVFSTSESGARRNIALALVEDLLEEETEETGGGSGDGTPFDFYATLLYQDKDYETQNTPGLDSDSFGGIIGVTLRDAHYFAGVAIDYSKEDATFKENAGEQDTDELGLSIYGTYYPLANKNLFVSGAFRYGDRDFDTRRNVLSRDENLGVAKGSADGNSFSLLGGAGYTWPLQNRSLIGLSGWLVWNDNNTDGYTESGALPESTNNLTGNLRFEDDDYSTFDGILTATLLHSIPINNGRVIPSLSLSYVHEFESDTRTINARLADAPDQVISFRTNEADENYFRINAAVNVELNQGATLYASYTGTVGHDWRNENLFAIGISVLF